MEYNKDVYTLDKIKELIKPVIDKHGITEVYLFGSYARNEARSDSDIDLYCSSGDIETLIQESAFIRELEAALNKKVDLVTIGSQMHPFFKEQLDNDMIRII